MPKYIPLTEWLALTFGEFAPSIETARRWCRQGKIHPRPQKIGRGYYLHPDAKHVDNSHSATRLVDRIRA